MVGPEEDHVWRLWVETMPGDAGCTGCREEIQVGTRLWQQCDIAATQGLSSVAKVFG